MRHPDRLSKRAARAIDRRAFPHVRRCRVTAQVAAPRRAATEEGRAACPLRTCGGGPRGVDRRHERIAEEDTLEGGQRAHQGCSCARWMTWPRMRRKFPGDRKPRKAPDILCRVFIARRSRSDRLLPACHAKARGAGRDAAPAPGRERGSGCCSSALAGRVRAWRVPGRGTHRGPRTSRPPACAVASRQAGRSEQDAGHRAAAPVAHQVADILADAVAMAGAMLASRQTVGQPRGRPDMSGAFRFQRRRARRHLSACTHRQMSPERPCAFRQARRAQFQARPRTVPVRARCRQAAHRLDLPPPGFPPLHDHAARHAGTRRQPRPPSPAPKRTNFSRLRFGGGRVDTRLVSRGLAGADSLRCPPQTGGHLSSYLVTSSGVAIADSLCATKNRAPPSLELRRQPPLQGAKRLLQMSIDRL
jgi:hypothetical protein